MSEKPGILPIVFSLVLFPLLLSACSGKENPEVSEESGGLSQADESGAAYYSPPAWQELSLLKTGENPLWFEFGPGGPELIESPGSASLAPFAPWPHARFATGMQAGDGLLVMAVNQDGFLVLEAENRPAENTLEESSAPVSLYRAAGAFWEPYTAESFFVWDNKPAVLLYRNDFFAEPEAPPLRPQVYVLDRTSPVPLAARVPALESFPADGEWDAEQLRRGSDGFWYYRMKEKGSVQNESAYFRVRDLSERGEQVSVGEWRDSSLPEGPENIPPCLADILYTAQSALDLDEAPAIRVVSPEFPETRLFAAGPGHGSGSADGDSRAAPLAGYCDEARSVALAILPDGRGLSSGGNKSGIKTFSLPALPEDFVYTGAALLGSVLAVSWEEQREAGIGAAGFMVKTFSP